MKASDRPAMSYVDAHIHLADPAYADKVEHVLEIARKENVVALVANSMDFQTSTVSVELAIRNLSLVYGAVGIHPWNAQNVDSEELDRIHRLIQQKGDHVSAIGEIGLDKSYAKNQDHLKRQRQLFERQLTLAEKTNLPIIVHSRGSAREVLDTLSSHNQKKVLMHWYSGPLEYVEEISDNGWMLSFGPSILYVDRTREVVSKAPLESLLTETDGPVAYRGPFHGRETTPEFVKPVVEEAARIRKIYSEAFSNQILKNFDSFFRVKKQSI